MFSSTILPVESSMHCWRSTFACLRCHGSMSTPDADSNVHPRLPTPQVTRLMATRGGGAGRDGGAAARGLRAGCSGKSRGIGFGIGIAWAGGFGGCGGVRPLLLGAVAVGGLPAAMSVTDLRPVMSPRTGSAVCGVGH